MRLVSNELSPSLALGLTLRFALALALSRRRLSLRFALFPPNVAIVAHLCIVQSLLILVTELDLLRLSIGTVQGLGTSLFGRPFLLLGLEPGTLGSGHDFRSVLHQVITLVHLHLGLRQLLLELLFLENLLDLALKILRLLGPRVGDCDLNHSADNLGTLGLTGLHGRLDNLTVGFSGDCAGATGATGTSGTTDTMQIDFVALWGFVVDNGLHTLDI